MISNSVLFVEFAAPRTSYIAFRLVCTAHMYATHTKTCMFTFPPHFKVWGNMAHLQNLTPLIEHYLFSPKQLVANESYASCAVDVGLDIGGKTRVGLRHLIKTQHSRAVPNIREVPIC